MFRALATPLLLAALAAVPACPQQGDLDGSETLFTVMAAINAAGYDADLESPANHPLRFEVRNYLATRQLASVAKLKEFFAARRRENWTAELGQYITFALMTTPPPAFQFRHLTYQLPPDAQRLEGLGPLLAEFYKEADIADLWRKAQPAFEAAIERYHEPVMRALLEINMYLRNPTSGVSGRRFMVVLSLLSAPNQIQVRSYEGDYFIVISPSPEPQIDDIRYSYLHYALEPVITRAQAKLQAKNGLAGYAQGAPFLEEHYKNDFLLLATASLVKAIESRLAHLPAKEKQAMVDKAWRQGFILTPHFAEQLPVYEKQPQAMRLYFPEMVDAIDLAKEEARVRELEFDQTPPVRRARTAPVKPPESTPLEKALTEAEDLYRRRDVQKARETYLAVIRQTRDKSAQAKAYYGLARIAALQNDPELSVELFRKTLELEPEPHEKAWTLVYLGRLSDAAGDKAQAAGYFQAALAVEGASEAARKAAQEALAKR
ncbi:MAG: tetratricopeptide repeat protein [Bryobacteraceae bacterium]|nr:tetratricopeptide repeat protein [Bryobacteraceae bacterium]